LNRYILLLTLPPSVHLNHPTPALPPLSAVPRPPGPPPPRLNRAQPGPLVPPSWPPVTPPLTTTEAAGVQATAEELDKYREYVTLMKDHNLDPRLLDAWLENYRARGSP